MILLPIFAAIVTLHVVLGEPAYVEPVNQSQRMAEMQRGMMR